MIGVGSVLKQLNFFCVCVCGRVPLKWELMQRLLEVNNELNNHSIPCLGTFHCMGALLDIFYG